LSVTVGGARIGTVSAVPTSETPFEVQVGDGVLVGHRGGAGPPALVLHGGPGLPDYLEPCAAELATVFSTIRYSQRGNPPSTVGPPYSVEDHMNDALAVLDHAGVERAWATGHSWGGHLALHLAVAHPERLHGVVCINTLGARNDVLPEFKQNLTRSLPADTVAWLEDVDAREDAGTATKAESREAFATIWPYYFADPETAPPFPFEQLGEGAETFRAVTEHFDRRTLEDGLRGVHLPVLFVHGDVDPLPARGAVETAALMPNGTVELLHGCGHFPWLEQPGELSRTVAGFLGAHDEP
jgi:proline iminopeptidase